MRSAWTLLAALGTSLVAAGPAAANERVLADRSGAWDLSRLGAGALTVPPDGAGERSVGFSLPAGTRQGPSRWYLVRLHFRATLSRNTRSGELLINGSTNGRTSEAVLLKVRRRPGRAPRIAWNTLDLIRGGVDGAIRGRTVELDVQNYLQDGGVRPGRNVLTFDVDRLGGARLERLHVFADSGIRVSPRSPANLVLEADVPERSVRAGETFEIGYTVFNDGERPALNVGVGLETPSGSLRVSGANRLGTLASGATRSGRIRVHATQSGRYSLNLVAESDNTNRPLAEVVVPVGASAAATDSGSSSIPLIVAAGVILLAIAVTTSMRARTAQPA